MQRWKGVNIFYENWWDNQAQEYVPDIAFAILDNFKLTDARRKDSSQLALPFDDGQHQRSLCYIKWNMTPFASFKNGDLRTLDLDTFFQLPNAAAKRAYRYLNLRLPDSGLKDFDLKSFACQHVGFSSSYKPGRLRKQVQETIVGPLEQNEFIEPMPPKRRFITKDGRDRVLFARKASTDLSPPQPQEFLPLPQECPPISTTSGCNTPSPLIGELTHRHLGGKLAAKFAETYPAEYLQQKIDYFDFTLSAQSIKNPAGWLRKAIEDDFGMPPGYVSPAERQRQQEAQHATERTAAEERRQKQEQAARKRDEEAAIRAKWQSLTLEEQAEIDAQLEAQADPNTIAMEDESLKGTLKRLGQQLRRDEYIRQLLQKQGIVEA